MDAAAMLEVAYEEARKGLSEGGIPIGAALFSADGALLGSGHNRRVQDDDPSVHGETGAFRAAGRQRDYRAAVMVTTLSPRWYCSGLGRQFNTGAVVSGTTGRRSWSPRCRRAGTAAAWCDSSTSVPSSSVKRGRSAVATTGWPRTACRSLFSTTNDACR